MPYILLFIAFIIGILYKYFNDEAIKEQKEKEHQILENQKRKLADLIKQNIEFVKTAIVEFQKFFDFNRGYFSNYELRQWKIKYKNLVETFKDSVSLLAQCEVEGKEDVQNLLANYKEGTQKRTKYNSDFIKNELKVQKDFFDDIDGKSLDLQQRTAIVTDEDNNLVVAGAGSGKTTTIAGKVSYFIHRYNIDPKKILLIAFTRKACEEMRERIRNKMKIDIEVMTFHKLGLEIIAETTQKRPTIFDESKLKPLINKFISELKLNPVYFSKFTQYFTEYLKPYKREDEFESHGFYIQFMKDNNIKTYKQIQGRTTMLRETCKSMEEVMIANFLFLNNVQYEYESKYKFETATKSYAQYKPDFYLPEYDIYIEHFALIDTNNNVPHWFQGDDSMTAKEKYNQQKEWKRTTHANFGSALIETYSYEKYQGELLPNLESKLNDEGVVLSPKTPQEVWDIINELAEDELKSFTQLIITFLTLLKSNNYSVTEVTKKNNSIKDKNDKMRNEAFLEIFSPILEKYNSYLKTIGEIDFSDMINHATELVLTEQSSRKYNYVIIDEFQDISIGRYKLIKSILDDNPGCKSFCVGDDWQSIYRFSGSDISIFTEFEKSFGYTARSFIESTYRFGNNLIDISSTFILKNPKQVPKNLMGSNANQKVPYQIIYSETSNHDHTKAVLSAFYYMIQDMQTEEDLYPKILILGRYNHDVEILKKITDEFSTSWNSAKETFDIKFKGLPGLEIEFMTIHRAKGLEADYVILLNCSSGKYGFPSEQADDPILNLLLTQADQFPNGEERRLFYVALTRCKRKIFLITNSKYKSKFIVELENDNNLVEVDYCPQCKTGILFESSGTSKNGYKWNKVSCSNWNWGCNYIKWN